jgi:hypothetical protein
MWQAAFKDELNKLAFNPKIVGKVIARRDFDAGFAIGEKANLYWPFHGIYARVGATLSGVKRGFKYPRSTKMLKSNQDTVKAYNDEIQRLSDIYAKRTW